MPTAEGPLSSTAPTRPEYITQDSSQTLVNREDDVLATTLSQSAEQELNDFLARHKDDRFIDDNESQITFTNSQEKIKGFDLDDDLDFPEGGKDAYLVVFGSFMGLIACFGIMNIIGAIESYVKEHQLKHYTDSSIGWVFSIHSFLTYTFCIFSGTYFDRNGTKTMLITGTVMVCSGLVATASCQELWQFILAFSILTSIGNGLLMSPLVSVVAHYFKKKRGMFSSLATVGGSLGGVVFPIMLRSLYVKIGFTWSIRILALICGFCLSFAIALAKERLHPLKLKDEDHINPTFGDRFKVYLSSLDLRALKDLKFLFCILGSLFAEISTVSCSTYFASYSISKGYTITDSYLLITLVNLGTIPGRIVSGILSDIIGRFNVMIITVLLTGLVNLTIWLPFGYSLKVLYAYSIIYGVCSGSIFSLLPVCCGQISRTDQFGQRYSTMYFMIAFGVLGGIPIGGAIISDSSYNWFIVFTAITAALSSVFFMLSKYYCVGTKVFVKF